MRSHPILSVALAALAFASVPVKAATVAASATAPIVNDEDIANYGEVSSTDKWFYGTGADGGVRGQSITTGGAAVRLKSITYQDGEGYGAAPTKTYALRVGKITGTNFALVHSETATQTSSWPGGQYMTWTFSTPVILEPYTTYGIDVGMTGSTSEWWTGIPYINVTADDYAGGSSYTSGTGGIGTSSITSAIASDRTFHLDIERPLAPVFSLVAPSPADNATDAYASREIVMTFSQNVTAGAGNLTIRNLTDNSDTLLPANDSRLTYDQNVVRINPAGLLTWNKNYAIRIDAGTFLGNAAAPIPAISDDTTWNFTTLPNDPLLSAIAAIKGHVNNSAPLTGPQISAHKTTIDNQRQRFAENTAIINAIFDLISTYDTVKGPLFVSGFFFDNATSFDRTVTTGTAKNSISPENYHWVIYTVMQYAMDLIYTPENLAKYEATLTNYKFGSHTSFPGPCSPPANPANTHNVQINGSFPVTFGRLTQMWTTPARKPTGTYLAPGTIATVTVPPALVNAGYKVRVGAHAWDLSARRDVKRLERASRLYAITSSTTKIASPYGGGIYLEVPFGASAGVVGVTVTGGVRAPYFSAKSFHQSTATEWTTERTNPAPWADFQSEKFMCQVPRQWIYNMTGTQATQLMVDWDKAMDAINSLMGFDLNRGKETMYCQTDVIMRSSVHAPGYPAVNVTSNVNSSVSPAGYANNYLVRGPGASPTAASTEFHEQGHAYFFPKFAGETESNVNLLQPAMLQRKFGYNFDTAHRASIGSTNTFQTIDNTAVAWMCTFNFSPKELPMAGLEKDYQLKGHAKFMDIARLFGWEGLDAYWRSFMEDDANNVPVGYGTDDLLLRLSRHVGQDIRPLFHFWGIHPENPSALAAAIAAENIPASLQIRDLLLHYKSIVPANNAAFRSFATSWWGRKPLISGAWEETDHAMQWDETEDADGGSVNANIRPNGDIYVEATADDIRGRVDELVDLYFSLDTTAPTLAGSAIVDDQGGGPVFADDLVTYTVTFSEDMNAATVSAADFGNAGSAPITIGTVSETAPDSGVFTVQVTPTGAGNLQLKVNAGAVLADMAGNPLDTSSAIADSDIITVAADVTGPMVVLLVPADNASEVPAETNLSLTFDKNVMKGSGDIVIKDSGGTPVHTIAVADTTVSGATVTINPPSNLTLGSGYYVEIPGAAITDISGNPFAGISGFSAWNFTISSSVPGTTPISIVNPSFETPNLVTDTSSSVSGATWRRIGNGSNPLGIDAAGLAKRVGTGTFATILDPTPDTLDAEQVLYLNGPTESVFQVLTATLQANTTYTLTVDAGDRDGLTFQPCEIRLGTAANPLVSADFGLNLLTGTVVSNTTPVNGAGANDGWQTWVTTFTTGSSPAGLGKPLRVEIVTTGGIQSYFDNVRLIATPVSTDPTPPTLAGSDIVDDKGGGQVFVDELVTYTVTFSEDMDAATVDAADFGNAGSAPIMIGTVSETAPDSGVFTVQVTPTGGGSLQLQVNAGAVLTDEAGNPLDTTSAILDNDTIAVTADFTGPTVILLVPADNVGDVPAETNLSLTFDEDVMKGNGDIVIYDSGGTPVQTIAVADTTVSGATVTINPPSDLAPGSGYYVEIPGAAITDLSGNPFAGISGSSAWNFTTSSATPISIVNPSFETPDLVSDSAAAVSGATWRRVGNGSNPLGLDAAGLQKRVGGYVATVLDPTPDLLDAEQALYLNGPTESVFQVLTATLQANTTYTLTVDAGDRTDTAFQACEIRLGTAADPLVSADFGANLLTGTVVSNTTPVNGVGANDGWQTWVTTFTTGPSPADLGKQLRVEIVTTGGVQSCFDNVRLVATPAGPPTTGFAGWQAANGTTGAINEDHDNDGASNGIEWFLGGNTDTTGFTGLPGVSNTGGTLSVTWTKDADYTGNYGTDFVVETSATLTGPWTAESSPGNVTITGNDVTYTFPAPLGDKNFARLKVTGP
jgi:methionine-rich copper-binding protein CopC